MPQQIPGISLPAREPDAGVTPVSTDVPPAQPQPKKIIVIRGKGGVRKTIEVSPELLNDPAALEAEAVRQLGEDFIKNVEPPDADAERNRTFFGDPGIVETNEGGDTVNTSEVRGWMRSPTGQWVKTGLGAGAAAVGGTAGSVGGPPGAIASGYAAQQGVEDLWDLAAGRPLSVKEHAINAALAPVAELGSGLVRQGLRGARRMVFGAADEATEAAARAAERYGVDVTPSQLNPESGGAAALDYAGQRIPGSRGVYAQVYERQGQQIEEALQQSLEESLPQAYRGPVTVEGAGARVRGRGVGADVTSHGAPEGAFAMRQRVAREGAQRYTQAGAMGDAAGLALPGGANPLIAHARAELAALEQRGLENLGDQRLAQVYREIIERGTPTAPTATGLVDAAGKPIMAPGQPPPDIPLSQLLTWRVQMAPYLPRFEAAGAARGAGGREHLYGLLDRSISALASQDGATARALRDADVFYRQTVAPVRELSLRVGAKDVAPREALTRLIQDPDQARSVMYLNRMSDAERQMAAAGWWESQIERASQTGTGTMRRDMLLRQYRGLSPEMQNIVTGGAGSEMHDVLDLMTNVSRHAGTVRRSSGTPEGVMIAGTAAAVTQRLMSGDIKGAAALIGAAGAPNVMARFITRPGVARAIAIGSRSPLPRATRLGGYLATQWQEVQDEVSQGLDRLQQGVGGEGEGETGGPPAPESYPQGPQAGLFEGPPAPEIAPRRRQEHYAR